MFIPIGNNIVIDPSTEREENVTEGGINLGMTDTLAHKTVRSGKVVSVGENVKMVKNGDMVIYESHAAHEFDFRGQEYISVQESSVIGYERGE